VVVTFWKKSGGKKASKPRRGGAGETLKTMFFAILIALAIRTFLVQAFRIPSGSMEDTLLVGDFLLVDKITYGPKIPGTNVRLPGWRKPRRGDILVFKDPRTDRDFIKRCVATGGETIQVRDNEVAIDTQPLAEPYKEIKSMYPSSLANFGPHRVAPDCLFMMGDNRNNSQDSRVWGDLTPDRVVGRAFVLYWSTDADNAPSFVRNMRESWVKGLFQLLLGRPRLRRLGTWLAKDYRGVYEEGFARQLSVPPHPTSADDGAPASSDANPHVDEATLVAP
jgi:signal peptidase I